ncbi:MAG: F0F1 ATP synthase subunit A [Verrucomicrobia bacterium]|nr:F0F1 ATP synthase subunit A [Verrucomicrobiota bacterium]
MIVAAKQNLFESPTVFHIGPVPMTETVVVTWGIIAIFTVVALYVRSRLSATRPGGLQTLVEGLVTWLDGEIDNIIGDRPQRYFPLIATLFLFVLTLNLVSNIPFIESPTGDPATTVALAIIVFLSVPFYGIASRGVAGYFATYLRPTPFMLPLNIISEVSRTLSLAVRLFGNVMSGGLIVGVLISIVPLVVPLFMMFLGLITSVVQAYIFPVLAMVYIGGAVRLEKKRAMKHAEETG